MVLSRSQITLLKRLEAGEVCKYLKDKKRFSFINDVKPIQANTIYLLTNVHLIGYHEGEVQLTEQGRRLLKDRVNSI